MVKKQILFFGPLPQPITGQSIAFQNVCEHLLGDNLLINTTYFGKMKLLNSLYSILLTIYYFLFKSIGTVYFTASRSRLGFIKDFFLVFIAHFNSVRVITHIHGADFDHFLATLGIMKSFVLRAFSKIDTCIVLLDEMKSSFERFPGMRIEIVFNCYGKEFERSNVGLKEDLTVLYLSNIMMSKGILDFMASAKEVMSRFSHVKYIIAGSFVSDEIYTRDEIEWNFNRELHAIQELFGKERIQFIGSVCGQEKVEVFEKSSIFVLPSYYKSEAFPISFLEAMRTGNAIVTTEHNYLPRIINGNNGIVVPVKSVDQLVSAQEELILNPSRLQSIQHYNINFAKRNYNSEAFITKIEHILEGL